VGAINMITFTSSEQTNRFWIMTTQQLQLHKNINMKASMLKISPSLNVVTIKFNAMVLRNAKSN